MSAAAISNPVLQGESKGAKKKKSKGDAGAQNSEAAADKAAGSLGEGGSGAEGGPELHFLRELQKNIRNIKKKIAATQKVDAIVAENPDLTLEDLLTTKKINADQKLQAERKPGLQTNLQELEDELDRYKKVEESVVSRNQAEIDALREEHEREKSALRSSISQEAAATSDQHFQERLLHLTKFLRAAAAKRQDGDESSEESRAFEGALLLVYGGDMTAVQAIENIINGSDELVPSVDGTKTSISYKEVLESFSSSEDTVASSEKAEDTIPHQQQTSSLPDTDPTVANAGLTEIEAAETEKATVNSTEVPSAPEASVVDDGAANAAAEAGWQNMTSSVTSAPDDWVQVQQIPRDPSETETGTQATIAVAANNQSWAEDVPVEAPPVKAQPTQAAAAPAPTANDGFHEVHHGRTPRGRGGYQGEYRGRGRGGFRGDRGDGPFRGRGGYRGDRGGGEGGPRGRGRGGFRGPRGPPRGESGP